MDAASRNVPAPPKLTELLHAWRDGDDAAFGKVIVHVQAELRRMATSRLHGDETPSLAANDLLQESLLKMMQAQRQPDWASRAHFFATASLTMRSVLVDHARARRRDKRGGSARRLDLTLSNIGEESMVADLLTLDAALRRLEQEDARVAEILQLTYFAGLKRDDIATVLDISLATVDRELRFGRAWLSSRLQRDLEA